MRGWEARGQSGAHDPERGEPREPVRDAPVERGDGVDLSVAVLDRRDLHAADGTSKRWYLEEDLGCRLRLAALRHELDRAMEVGLAAGEALGERQRVAGFHQDVQAPALDLGPLAPFDLGCLDPVAHGASVRLPRDEPSRAKVGALPTHFGQSGELTGARAEALARTREQLVHTPRELGEAGLEHRSLRVRLRHQGLGTAAKLRLHVAEPALQAVD